MAFDVIIKTRRLTSRQELRLLRIADAFSNAVVAHLLRGGIIGANHSVCKTDLIAAAIGSKSATPFSSGK